MSTRKKFLDKNIYPHTPTEVHSSKPELFARVAKSVAEQEAKFTSHDISQKTGIQVNRVKMYLLVLLRLRKIERIQGKGIAVYQKTTFIKDEKDLT